MIKEVRVNLRKNDLESRQINQRDTDAFTSLTSIISYLNQQPAKYCLVINVVEDHFPERYNSRTKQIQLLTKSLTKRELEVFGLAIKGLSNKLIAEKLFITIETVKTHRKNIVSKAGVKNIEEIKDWLIEMQSYER